MGFLRLCSDSRDYNLGIFTYPGLDPLAHYR